MENRRSRSIFFEKNGGLALWQALILVQNTPI
nr:MAG TPA: hypothetical protein [Caudoviricetes sp.]